MKLINNGNSISTRRFYPKIVLISASIFVSTCYDSEPPTFTPGLSPRVSTDPVLDASAVNTPSSHRDYVIDTNILRVLCIYASLVVVLKLVRCHYATANRSVCINLRHHLLPASHRPIV